MKKILTAALVLGMFMPLMFGAQAQEKKGKTAEERFAAMDKNGDKKLSKEEFLANITDEAKKDKAGTRFAGADKDKDGHLSLEEYKELAAMQKKKN